MKDELPIYVVYPETYRALSDRLVKKDTADTHEESRRTIAAVSAWEAAREVYGDAVARVLVFEDLMLTGAEDPEWSGVSIEAYAADGRCLIPRMEEEDSRTE